MCRTCGRRHNSLESDDDTSPGSLNDVSLESGGPSAPFMVRSPGKVSPLRGRTMKEYEEQLARLKKENFSLKLRIYFLEEKMGQKFDKDDKDIYQTNIELKVENEALKKELYDKQELLRQASSTLTGLVQQHQEQVDSLKMQCDEENQALQEKIHQLQKEVDDYANNFVDGNKLGELTQLCSLAFSTDDMDVSLQTGPIPQATHNNKDGHLAAEMKSQVTSSATGFFSMKPNSPNQNLIDLSFQDSSTSPQPSDQLKVQHLQEEIKTLQGKIRILEKALSDKQMMSEALEADIQNLKRELEDREEKILDLEAEVSDKDQRVDQLMQDLETRHTEIDEQNTQIQTLHEEICRVEPQIEVKVQEIVERDRIIEEKIEKIEHQNKILVEIQITLDEKQKQIAELEDKLVASQEKINQLVTEAGEKTNQLQNHENKIEARDKEIIDLKKEVKRLTKKSKDLVAELKEALDMVNKFMWEAQTTGKEDEVKEMVEDENARLWAELEQKKTEISNLRTEHEKVINELQQRTLALQDAADRANREVQELMAKCENNAQVINSQQTNIKEKSEEITNLEKELAGLRGDVNSREGLLRSNQGIVEGLKNELAESKEQLQSKKDELAQLQEELKKKNNDIQDLVNKELWERNKEIEKLQKKLTILNINHNNEIEALRKQMFAGNQFNIPTQPLIQSPSIPASNLSVQNDNHPNIINFTQVNNAYNVGESNEANQEKASVVPLAISDDCASTAQFLYQEMAKIRGEAEALKRERLVLNDKLAGLQRLHKETCQNSNETESLDIYAQIEGLKQQLEETKEENEQKEKDHNRIVCNFQDQIDKLRNELGNAKKKITQQISEVSVRKYKEHLKFYKGEVTSLRKRLAESNNACDLLRNRMEELVDFMERILEMERDGLINLSQFSTQDMSALQHSLNESRALSQSLSQSLMLALECNDSCMPEDMGLSSISSMSSYMQKGDSLEDISEHLPLDNISIQQFNADENLETAVDPEVQSLAKLTSEIDLKGKELDTIAEKVCHLSTELHEKVSTIHNQSSIIDTLQQEVTTLKDQLKYKDKKINILNKHTALKNIPDEIECFLVTDNEQGKQMVPISRESRSIKTGRRLVSVSSCSDSLPPPPADIVTLRKIPSIVRTEQELEICHQPSDNSSLGAMKSAYSTDIAIKAHSNNPNYFDRLNVPLDLTKDSMVNREECLSAGGVLEHTPVTVMNLLSPSESEAWSEPDRNVSLARIGLDTCSLATSLDRSLSRSRQTRTSAAISSESEGEHLDEQSNASGGKANKRRCEYAEIRRLCAKLRNVEQLNETLKAELNIYQAISQQIPETSQLSTSDKSVETYHEDSVNLKMNPIDTSITHLNLPVPLLDEIRALRVKLEEAIENNDHLRDQLEAAIAVQPSDDPYVNQLTMTLQATTEQLQFAQEKLTDAYRNEQVMNSQFSNLYQKYEDKVKNLEELKGELELTKSELLKHTTELSDTRLNLNKKESIIKELTEKVVIVEAYQIECETKINELDKTILNQNEKITLLQNQASSEAIEGENNRLKDELHSIETKLIEITKERLSLVGERTRLQAQLVSVQAQIDEDAHHDKTKFDAMLCQYKESEEKAHQLQAQLESERQLTSNLQMQLDSIQNPYHSTSTSTLQDASDLNSPGSVTSFEFVRPTRPVSQPTRPTSLGSLKERCYSGNRRNHSWSENKENVIKSSENLRSLSGSNIVHRSRRAPSLPQDLEEVVMEDGAATSGDSPDLGIGSDCHFSSLERGSQSFRTLTTSTNQMIRTTSMCSEPSHNLLLADNERLRKESNELNMQLHSTKDTLRDALDRLALSNQRKETVEKAVYKQLRKTHDVLRKTKFNLKQTNPPSKPSS